MDFLSGSYQVNRASDSMTSVYPPAVSSQPSSRPFDGPVTSTPESQRSVRDNNPSEPLVPLSMSGAEPHATRPSEGLLPSNGVTEAHTGVPRTEAEEPLSAYSGRSNDVEDSAVSFLHDEGSVTPQATMSGPPTSAAPSPGSQADKDDMTGFPRGGYIPPFAVFSAEPSGRASARGGRGNPRQESSEPGALLYGDLDDYLENAKDPYASQLAALSRGADKERTVTATSTTPPYTYSPTYNPYSDNIDVDQIPDSPYHNYAYAEDPFPSPYSTHSRLENYGTEFNNRYYHEQRISPNISWNEYTRRKKEADEARKREEQLQQEGRIGVLEAADSSFQGLIGFPYEPRRRTNRTSRS
ncbi:hypothetical protein BESB_052570 [Besnoitia besnoiti]|uniref:Uncharacterized protein n=1 Tax=Besnoitia besnoiti TaxID=94643 RepID=A0A2A9MI24_BESBE|nr:hypothetical protein BESB_052570 [Besnoitia besnoiti]PFH35606.1 hypothetical protein BESB_052570 [Besnoitia besnoiti]